MSKIGSFSASLLTQQEAGSTGCCAWQCCQSACRPWRGAEQTVPSLGRTPGLTKSSHKPLKIYLERKKGSQQRDDNVKDHIPHKNKDEI